MVSGKNSKKNNKEYNIKKTTPQKILNQAIVRW